MLDPDVAADAIKAVKEPVSLFGNTNYFYPYKVLRSPIVNERTSFNLVAVLAFSF